MNPLLPAQLPLASDGCGRLCCFSAGLYHWAGDLWVLIIWLFFLPVMLPSEVPRLTTDSPVRVFLCVWKFLSFFKTPFLGRISVPTSFVSLFLFYIFFPISFRRQWGAFLGAWCPLLAFRSYFVEFTQCSNVLLMNLLGRKWSPCRIPLPSSANPPKASWRLSHFEFKKVLET